MVAEIYAGLSAFKTMFDLAKGLKDINDATVRNVAVIALQEQILSAQMQQAELIERVGQLEKEVAAFDKWDSEKEKYDLKTVASTGMLAYMLKPDARSSQPPHWICTNCYQNRKPSIVQYFDSAGRDLIFKCHDCTATFRTHGERPAWIS